MKAARIHSFGPPDVVVVEEVPVPWPGPNEVLVRVMAAGVAPWDAIIREGKSKVSCGVSNRLFPSKPERLMGGSLVQTSMRAVPVVVMEPMRKVGITDLGVGISLSVGPLAQSGLDEALGFAVGARSVGSGEGMAQLGSW